MKIIFTMLILSLFTLSVKHNIRDFNNERVPLASVKFIIDNEGMPVTGTIDSVVTKVDVDALTQQISTIEAWAYPATIKTGIAIRDKHLTRSDYFNVSKFPSIHLASTKLQKRGRNRFSGEFNLTIRDITKTITIPFAITREKNTSRYNGSFTINRLDFSLGEKSTVLSENVIVNVEAVIVNQNKD